MKFNPKTEKEIEEGNLLENGEYGFDILIAEDTYSKKGNEMIKLKLKIYAGDSEKRLFDYLLEEMEFKLRHFCDSVGLLSEYNMGALTADMCIGRSGKCNIVKKEDKVYGLQNVIKDYVCKTENVNEEDPQMTKEEFKGPF